MERIALHGWVRPAFDLTFSAPKSVSLAASLPTGRHPRGDRSVVRAHDEAVRATLDWVEGTFLETRGWEQAEESGVGAPRPVRGRDAARAAEAA